MNRPTTRSAVAVSVSSTQSAAAGQRGPNQGQEDVRAVTIGG